ncbi:MAG: MetQ/NlpA family ABC transporter substrate-binding protein [Bacillota bacterium]
MRKATRVVVTRACLVTLVAIWGLVATGLVVGGLSASLAGCARKSSAAALTMGLIPIEDTLPFWVAERQGYFQEEGVAVNLKTFASAAERDAALTAGEIDGAVADLVAVALLHAGGTRVGVVSLTLGASGSEGRIAILSPPGTALTVDDLRGKEIALSPNSLIEFTVSRLLEKRGFRTDEIKTVAVAKIPVRFELLMAGKVAAAALPDPFAALAQKRGAHLVLDDTADNISQAVVLFRSAVLEQKSEQVQKVMRAYARAVADINASPMAFSDLLTEKAGVPEEVLDWYRSLHFPGLIRPSQAQVEDALNWLGEKGLLQQPLRYEDLVDPRFASEVVR